MKHLISLSGGMDSAVLLASIKNEDSNEVRAVSFTYGSKHNIYELIMARKLAEHYNIPHEIINLELIMKNFKSNLLQTGGDIPEGHYEEESMKQTVVPARNMIFSSILTGLAISQGLEVVTLAIHAGDHAIYPDCRPEFFYGMNRLAQTVSEGTIAFSAPFLYKTKGEIVAEGLKLGVPFELTRTCYKAQEIACGKCGSCTERLEAFALNNVKDPIDYE